MKKAMSDRSITTDEISTTKWQADLVLAKYVKTNNKRLFSYIHKKMKRKISETV